jgi:hypothetical protein
VVYLGFGGAHPRRPRCDPHPIDHEQPRKYGGLEGYGLTITGRVALPAIETTHTVHYLRTERERMGHAPADSATATEGLGRH